MYRKIKKTDKLPHLPKGLLPFFISKIEENILIFALSKDKNYTIVWDGEGKYPNHIYFCDKYYNDEWNFLRPS